MLAGFFRGKQKKARRAGQGLERAVSRCRSESSSAEEYAESTDTTDKRNINSDVCLRIHPNGHYAWLPDGRSVERHSNLGAAPRLRVCRNAHTQRVQLDEAVRVGLVVSALVVVERRDCNVE